MRFQPWPVVGLMLVGCVAQTPRARHEIAAKESTMSQTQQAHYPKGSQPSFDGPPAYFTGDVHVDVLFPQNEHTTFSGAYVTFQAGARTVWHCHPAGQHMVVTAGTCLTGTRDGTVVEAGVGDAVWCPPDTDHWHGATPERAMTHLVVTGSKADQNVVWKEPVTDAQYLGQRPARSAVAVDELLDARQQALIPISALTASGDLERLKVAVEAGLEAGLTVNEVKEVMVHLYAYAGFPRALNALGTLLGVVEARKARGLTDEVGADATPLPTGTDPLRLGEAVQTELVGRPVTGPLFDFAPVINDYLKSHLFGDIFARDVLDRRSRELVTVAALANLEGVGAQLQAHLGIAQNTGVSKEQLQALAVVFERTVGAPKHDLTP